MQDSSPRQPAAAGCFLSGNAGIRNRGASEAEKGKNMSRLVKRVVLSLSVLVFAYVAMGFMLGRTNDDKTYRTLTVFSEVLEHIQHDYVEDPDLHQVTMGALHGLLDSLDAESAY